MVTYFNFYPSSPFLTQHNLRNCFIETWTWWKFFKSQSSNVRIKKCYWVNAWVNTVNAKPFLTRSSLPKMKEKTWKLLELKINYVLTCRIKTEWGPLKFQNDSNWQCKKIRHPMSFQNRDHPDFLLYRRKNFPFSCLAFLVSSSVCFEDRSTRIFAWN